MHLEHILSLPHFSQILPTHLHVLSPPKVSFKTKDMKGTKNLKNKNINNKNIYKKQTWKKTQSLQSRS